MKTDLGTLKSTAFFCSSVFLRLSESSALEAVLCCTDVSPTKFTTRGHVKRASLTLGLL